MAPPKSKKNEDSTLDETNPTHEEVRTSSRVLESVSNDRAYPPLPPDLIIPVDIQPKSVLPKYSSNEIRTRIRSKSVGDDGIFLNSRDDNVSPMTVFSQISMDENNNVKMAVMCGIFFICMCCGVFSGLLMIFKCWLNLLIFGIILLCIVLIPNVTDVVFRNFINFLVFGYEKTRSLTDKTYNLKNN